MKKVAHILEDKGREVWTVSPDVSVLDALKLMAEKQVGALVVTDDSGLAGIVSERDYARKVILMGKRSHEASVAEVMTCEVACVDPELTVEECMALMTVRRIRHLPVLSAGNLAGIISIGDVVKAVIEEQEFVIDQLERYIKGC